MKADLENLYLLFLVLLCAICPAQAQIPYAHAHNDYQHKQPLQDALKYGFKSVEVDVHLMEDELYVAHIRPLFKRKKRTLRKLYLEPLRERIEQNGGQVYNGYDGPFYLMIDIKSKSTPTYELLREQLAEYKEMLTTYKGSDKDKGAVTVLLSGNRTLELVQQRKHRLVAIDGRPEDLGKGYSPAIMPLISDRYRDQLKWRGKGTVPDDEKKQLQNLCKRLQEEGKQLRLWASPEKKKVWRFLLKAGVGFINTDQLQRLHEFHEQRREQ